MFVDQIELELSSGKGGAGCVAFRREKFVVNGGPNGGDGGRGGDVWFRVDNNTHTLAHYHGKHKLVAENGRPGLGSNMTGKSASKLFVIVPPGTQVFDAESGELLMDLVSEGQEQKLLQGGKGGLGNTHFKSSTNQRPTYAQPGEPGETRRVRLELKLIADVGLVGFPNVGKSTLISTVSNATPEIANYEFTTLTPKLGQVRVSDFESFVMADIPGIIDGASEGRGLGLQFLRHIERTKTLLFMIDLASYMTMTYQYETLQQELERFSEMLATRAFAIALTRVDALSKEEAEEKIAEMMKLVGVSPSQKSRYGFDDALPFYEQDLSDESQSFDREKPFFMVPISSVAHENIKPLNFALHTLVEMERA
ncbi:GTPase ObgE [Sulfurimonas sp. HSL-3221]|uniref:GTPase ObgE n=1 Tax=Sulfurimonadaceae TaxID=2771471 RepID=UPI001E42A1C5|nr:GTPase ObgE [Sulfurimonas sp. HSL-3221]UFS63310.1 GTPase ObgE [Sulfurimonas sp. HSL-3221]